MLEQQIEILDWHHANGTNQTQTAQHFDQIYPNLKLKQPTISSWVKNEEKWRLQWMSAQMDGKAQTQKVKRTKQTEHPKVNEMLELWIAKAMHDRVILTGDVIRQKWIQFADMIGISVNERLNLSDGWLASLKKRCGLKEFKRHGEAASALDEDIEKETLRILEIIERGGWKLRDIFNMDETGLFWM